MVTDNFARMLSRFDRFANFPSNWMKRSFIFDFDACTLIKIWTNLFRSFLSLLPPLFSLSSFVALNRLNHISFPWNVGWLTVPFPGN